MSHSIPGLRTYDKLDWIVGGQAIVLHVLRFDAAAYRQEAFQQASIELPATISRSVRKRQAEYFFGRLAARHALAALDAHSFDIPTEANRAPKWPHGFIGSISHTDFDAAAVVLRSGYWHGIGIDIELPVADAHIDGLEEIVLCQDERDLLKSLPLSYCTALALAFSAKESFYKAVSSAAGRFIGFEAMSIDGVDLFTGQVQFTLTETVCAGWPQGQRGHIDFRMSSGGEILTCFLW
jgi:enterobactin synthetase component D